MDHHYHPGQRHTAHEPPRASDAALAIDPVCGLIVREDSPHEATHHDQRYVFCSAKCRAKLIAHPRRYLRTANERAPSVLGNGKIAKPGEKPFPKSTIFFRCIHRNASWVRAFARNVADRVCERFGR